MLKKPILFKKKKFFDKRGFFQEVYLLKELGIKIVFSALAHSKKNVIRGLHFQTSNKQTKIILNDLLKTSLEKKRVSFLMLLFLIKIIPVIY